MSENTQPVDAPEAAADMSYLTLFLSIGTVVRLIIAFGLAFCVGIGLKEKLKAANSAAPTALSQSR